jgi:hypothetical protein
VASGFSRKSNADGQLPPESGSHKRINSPALKAEATQSVLQAKSRNRPLLGGRIGISGAPGRIDELRTYNRA